MKLLLAYLALGALLALACDRRVGSRKFSARIGSALLCLTAWPLWAPLTLFDDRRPEPVQESSRLQRIRKALEEARSAVEQTSLDGLLPEQLLSQLLRGLGLVEKRHRELSDLLCRPEFAAVTSAGQHPATRARGENVQRLHQLRLRDERLLAEIAELAEALRSQLLVARYSGQQEGNTSVKDLVGALSARVESMDAWFDLAPAGDTYTAPVVELSLPPA
ncbi:MAG TPA: hypothetical protein VHM70_10405 [Polyangiaceae bacterium]|nr:hypothetical protein [Polyangiaceae bacterium]